MIENALKNASFTKKLTVKSMISITLIALGVILPQIVHLALGAQGGMMLLPMYLPVLVGGCILGIKWGLGVAVLTPIVSFAITSACGNAMPNAVRLPYMVAELMVFALVCGLFSNKMTQKPLFAFLAVISAQVAGRLAFVAIVAIFEKVSSITLSMVLPQIKSGLIGLAVQLVIVPIIIIIFAHLIKREGK